MNTTSCIAGINRKNMWTQPVPTGRWGCRQQFHVCLEFNIRIMRLVFALKKFYIILLHIWVANDLFMLWADGKFLITCFFTSWKSSFLVHAFSLDLSHTSGCSPLFLSQILWRTVQLCIAIHNSLFLLLLICSHSISLTSHAAFKFRLRACTGILFLVYNTRIY